MQNWLGLYIDPFILLKQGDSFLMITTNIAMLSLMGVNGEMKRDIFLNKRGTGS